MMLLLVAFIATGALPWWQRFELPSATRLGADRVRAATLMKRRSLADCEKAVELLELSLKRHPEDASLSLECAVALNALMRIRTHSNTLHITKMLDTPEHKKVWRRYGPRALELATRAKKRRPSDPEALVAYADAYFFANSVKGVLAAATTGSGLKFKANSKELIRKCPRADGGVGHCYLGAFFLMAPWPLCNPKLAEAHLTTAHKQIASRRNAYYMGVMHYRLGRPERAMPYFREAIRARCASPSEADFGDWMLAEAKSALAVCQKTAA